MALRHDSQGFLQGDAIDIGRALTEWTGIRADVRAIRQALLGGSRAASRQPASPMPRDNLGRFVRRDSAPSGTGSARAESATPRQSAGRTPATPTPAGAPGAPASTTAQARADAQRLERNRSNAPNDPARRDASGKFVRADGTAPGEFGGQPDAENSGALRGFFDRLTDAVSGDSLEQADPAVKAFREVAQPLAAGYGMLTGNSEEKKKEGWFRRIYSSLSGFRKDESTFNKAANKSLKTIEERPVSTEGSGSGFLGGLAGRFLPMLAMLFKGLLLPVAGAIAAWNVGRWIGEKLYAWMDKAGINTIIFDAFDGVKEYISKGWDGAISLWNTMSEGVGKGWDFIAGIFKSAYEGLKSIPVIGAAIQAAENLAKKAVEVVAPVVANAVDTAKKLTAKAVEVVAPAVTGAKQGIKDVTAGVKQGYSGESQAGAGRGSINPPMAGGAGPLDTRSTATKAGQWVGGAARATTDAAGRAYSATASAANSVLEAVMPKGYRGKAEFEGVKGGAMLSKNGSYTNSEAARIRELKASGENTTANLKGGMPVEIQDKISAQAKKYGLDPVMMQKIAAMESGGNAQAISSTGAIGIYQFTGKTASGVGIQDRFNVDQNIEGGMLLTQQNSAALKAAKLPVTAENLYMMHQLGPRAAMEVIRGAGAGKLKSEMSPGTQSGMNLNYGAKSRTAADYVGTNRKALDDRYALVTGTPAVARAAGAPAQTAYATAPRVPAITAPPAIADAPPVVSPMATGSNGKPIVKVSMPAQDVGQDVKDWRVALIHTGGISSGGR